MNEKLWGGRFAEETAGEVNSFTQSLSVDRRLWPADLKASIAHVHGLRRAHVISEAEAQGLTCGLSALGDDLQNGRAELPADAEDLHSAIEQLLTSRLGAVAGKLHTGRSRNDQVATATRLYLRGQIDELAGELKSLQTWLITNSEKHLTTLLPGLTHLQHAQPVTLAHHLMAYFWMLDRDRQRLAEGRKRVNVLPLGAAALAGNGFGIDREMLAHDLNFESLAENSLDAVSDRDFIVETLSSLALIMNHLSRFAEEIIRWNTPEYGFVQLSDRVTTGSSLMPQKKNPDVAELIRGRTGKVSGHLIGTLMVLKALPLSYNRDLQEDKPALFESLDTTRACVRLMTLLLENCTFVTSQMEKALTGNFSNATDLADYLVNQGVPFRRAHGVVGQVVKFCLEKEISLEELTKVQLGSFHDVLAHAPPEVFAPMGAVLARHSRGGTSPVAVKKQIELARGFL